MPSVECNAAISANNLLYVELFVCVCEQLSRLLVFMMSPSTTLPCKLFALDALMSEVTVLSVLQSIVHIKLTVSCCDDV